MVLALLVFQSYFSPIQTPSTTLESSRYPIFQSYFSPIQTSICSGILNLTSFNFNPILVRFKHPASRPGRVHLHQFQSYFSPIQTLHMFSTHVVTNTFQSYFSPIQTTAHWSHIRLEQKFQSYFSPIQTAWSPIGILQTCHFNPILVRFKL